MVPISRSMAPFASANVGCTVDVHMMSRHVAAAAHAFLHLAMGRTNVRCAVDVE